MAKLLGFIIFSLFLGGSSNPVSVVSTPTPTVVPLITATIVPTAVTKPSFTVMITPSPSQNAQQQSERIDYVKDLLREKGIGEADIVAILRDPRLNEYPVREVSYKAPNWDVIRAKLYAPDYVKYGVGFINQNRNIFENAETKYSVDKEVIAAIIAIETDYGRNTGSYVVINAVYSRMLQASASRWRWQAQQVASMAKICIKYNRDCYEIRGSYAGALGLVQFIPTSLEVYGVDGNGDGYVDLLDTVDAIPSASNFLVEHGWYDDKLTALARYYGSSVGYPDIVLMMAELMKKEQGM